MVRSNDVAFQPQTISQVRASLTDKVYEVASLWDDTHDLYQAVFDSTGAL